MIKAVIFDLDDTLLNRDEAIDNLFLAIFKKCYEDVNNTGKDRMLKKFKECDKRHYGKNNKVNVLESFFDEFPPKYRFPSNSIQEFWNNNFPNCFSINPNTLRIVNAVKNRVKIAIITNGATQRQKAKIMNTHLNQWFDIIIISEEVGFSKPDKRIFQLALNKLNVEPEDTLFVGDDLEKDINGCQNVNIKGIWFNPFMIRNNTNIKPYAEIHSFDRLLHYLT